TPRLVICHIETNSPATSPTGCDSRFYPHCSAIAVAMPWKVRLLAIEVLGILYHPFVYLCPFGVVIYVIFTISVGINGGKFFNHKQVFFEWSCPKYQGCII